MNKKTKNTYEAAFYLLYGAKVDKIEERRLSERDRKKKGISSQYTIHLKDVPEFAIRGWNQNIVYGDIQEFSRMRQTLKRIMRKN